MNPNRAKATRHELRQQPLVSGVLLLALVCVIVRTALLPVHEWFPGGAAIGDAIYDLAIAYVGAWFFNLLVVILPRLRDRERILDGAALVIVRLYALGVDAVSEIGLEPSQFGDLTDAGQLGKFELRLRDFSLADESTTILIAPDGSRNATWQEWVIEKTLVARDLYRSLVPYFSYFDSELIRLVNKISFSRLVDLGPQLPAIRPADSSLFNIHSQLAEFITACRELRDYYYSQVIMQPIPRDVNIVGHIIPATEPAQPE